LIFTRQNVPTYDRTVMTSAEGVRKGGYVLIDTDGLPDIILIATGSEVSLAVGAQAELAKHNIRARVVSLPSWEVFDAQTKSYRDSVLPPKVTKRLAIEAGVALGWHKYVGDKGRVISIERFGASAPASMIAEKFGFTVETVTAAAKQLAESITRPM
jgi:transketolase